MTHYRKRYSKKESNQDSADDESDNGDSEEFKFKEGHPGHGFACLEKMRLWKIPITSIPEDKTCLLTNLEISSSYPSDDIKEKREQYANMALLVFFPTISNMNEL